MRTFYFIAFGGRNRLMPEVAWSLDGRAWRPWRFGIWFRAFDLPREDMDRPMTPYRGDD